MAFRATSITQFRGYQTAKSVANGLRDSLIRDIASMAAGNTSGTVIRDLIEQLNGAIQAFNTSKAVPGISDYAQAQENDPTYDVVAEFLAMIAQIIVTRDALIASIPKSGQWNLWDEYVDGQHIQRPFTPAQTAGIRADLQAVVDVIV